ncbi:DUF4369 domain-containing protein [Subsaximicrobium wynnwilliamsii]|uniref:DUF4369 domain-containing protein n=1 Tax=Subsaximicrobium wynnwilliamsii TaxID=291179 RepID=A0A5C6ZID0_9FLAO|nr:DUF4369 domain-containing protein [Subsaximicrobium wynnwilliamsii]TXD82696.1 DUF4369 domain-containing protein [Subsaximicrobium wynnwilliamsii]TXD88431.1 DUF4369 domain-containing protein [Subsaximicrobium wynnwilliamsii]TXE02358.1 DUF4369 domain-containing protein [Subsaximicrobium wynnwilliamsii]
MKRFAAILITLVLFSCGNEQPKDFTLKGSIEDLKKGTVFLKRQQDSVLVTLDSLEINGNSSFELHATLEEPEILFLTLDKNDDEDGTVVFFADKGVTEINSTLKNFNYNAKVKGSKQQALLDEYLLMMSKFNDKNLDMLKERLESQMAQDSAKTNQLQKDFDGLLKRKYLYTINFAINHKDSELAPYLAISEIPNTSVKFLKQIYDALDDNIKNSKYGVMLKESIDEKTQA